MTRVLSANRLAIIKITFAFWRKLYKCQFSFEFHILFRATWHGSNSNDALITRTWPINYQLFFFKIRSLWDHESPQPSVHCRSLKCLPIRSRLNPVMSKARWVRYSLLSSGFFVFTMSLSVSDSSKTLFSLYIRRHFNWLFLINISVLFIYFFPKISSLLTCSVHGIPSILL